ncbi:enoyl-CoA hydratase-related protein [soil metagenome]
MPPLLITATGPVVTVTMDRPDVRNAFDEALVAELTAWARSPIPSGARVAVLRGAGRAFCAGADLAWMSRMVSYSHADNVRDASAMAAMFEALDTLPLPLIGRVHGAALGGGAGLAAICDIVVAADDAVFGFTEAKLGIVPAVIAPYCVAKIGTSAVRELFLTAARFSAARAREVGLVHAVAPEAGLDAAVDAFVQELMTSGPEAVVAAKRLIRDVAGRAAAHVGALTAETIAARRVSAEGQHGMRAFLEKRRASWAADE